MFRKEQLAMFLLAVVAGCTWFTPREVYTPFTEGPNWVYCIEPIQRGDETFAYALRAGDNYAIARACEDPNVLHRPVAGGMPLYWTVWAGRQESTRLLLERGANPEDCCPDGMRVFSYAARETDLGMVDLFLRHGAHINAFDADGRTPLHHACLVDAADIAALLVDRGAFVNVKDHEGLTPLDLTRGVDDKISSMLCQHNAILGHPRQAPTDPPPPETAATTRLIADILAHLGTADGPDLTVFRTRVNRFGAGVEAMRDLFKNEGFTLAFIVLDVHNDVRNGASVTVSLPLGVAQDVRMDFAPVLSLRLSPQDLNTIRRGDQLVLRGKPLFYYGVWNAPKNAQPVVRIVRDWPQGETYPCRWSEGKNSYQVALTEMNWTVIPRKSDQAPSALLWGTPLPVEFSSERARHIVPVQVNDLFGPLPATQPAAK